MIALCASYRRRVRLVCLLPFATSVRAFSCLHGVFFPSSVRIQSPRVDDATPRHKQGGFRFSLDFPNAGRFALPLRLGMSVSSLIEVNLGPVLLVNTYLYGIVTYQYASYWTTKFNDPPWIKLTVLLLFLMDTFHSSSLVWMAWVYTIENFTDPLGLLVPVWPYPNTIITTGLTAFSTQSFLSYRVYRLTKRTVLYFSSIAIAAGTLALGMVCAVKAFYVTNYLELPSLRPYLTVWLCMEMAIDLVICGILLYTLGHSRTGFAQSDTVIRRLMRAAVQTGCFATAFAAVTLVLFLTNGDTQLYSLVGIPISRVYSNALMDTILCRGELRDLVQRSRGGETNTQQTNTYGLTSLTPSVQLHIHKEVHTDVHYERSNAFDVRTTRAYKTSLQDRMSQPRSSDDS
ncbi:hypothetical protein CC2G_012969 [Coprinopsis cinerea AmutBmut pab1-1]|nr:hypothetical protein CC2G_012969 [Coprinopsis cinerea AmutBmut pab1-1]